MPRKLAGVLVCFLVTAGGWPILAGTIIAEAAPPIVLFDGWEAMASTRRCESNVH
jgi:hypothetical protein